MTCGDRLVELVGGENRRSLDLLAARAYFYVYRAHELSHPERLHQLRECVSISCCLLERYV